VNIHLRNISSSISDLQEELTSVANRFGKKTDDLANLVEKKTGLASKLGQGMQLLGDKMDHGRDKTNAKIDKAMYFLFAAWLLGDAFDTI